MEPATRTRAHRTHLGGFNGDLGDVSPDRGLGVGPALCVQNERKVIDVVGTGVKTAAERTQLEKVVTWGSGRPQP